MQKISQQKKKNEPRPPNNANILTQMRDVGGGGGGAGGAAQHQTSVCVCVLEALTAICIHLDSSSNRNIALIINIPNRFFPPHLLFRNKQSEKLEWENSGRSFSVFTAPSETVASDSTLQILSQASTQKICAPICVGTAGYHQRCSQGVILMQVLRV